ncbi:MliC family protein [Silvibacterium sp.]|uniref:MliC family protein n=1 Tax=Silvibacterium sp. TaxID=1964179 RepID=UPI0039E555E3
MPGKWLVATVLACGALCGSTAKASTKMRIRLQGDGPVTHETRRYACDSAGAKMGLPAGVFTVEYLNGAGNSLAVVPVGGRSLIFANVISGSGARYAAGTFIWWEAGDRGSSFSTDGLGNKATSMCHEVKSK